MKRLFCLLSLLTVLLGAAGAEAAIYWVNGAKATSTQSCTDSSTDPGVANSSKTIAQGISCGAQGDTIRIKAGTYAESITLPQLSARSGTSYGNAFTIEAVGGEAVTIRPAAGLHGLDLANYGPNLRYIVFRNLIVDGSANSLTGSDVTGVQIGGGGASSVSIDHIKFENIEVKNWSGNGYLIGADDGVASFVWVTSGSVHNVGQRTTGGSDRHGFYMLSSDHLIEGVDIYDVASGYGIQNYGELTLPSRNIYRYNRIHNTGTSTVALHAAMVLTTGSDNVAAYNLIYNNQNGIDVSGTHQTVIKNTLYQNSVGFACFGGCIAAINARSGSSHIIRDNYLVSNAINSVDTTGSSGTTASKNILGTSAAVFTAPASGDFHLTASAPGTVVNAGDDLSALLGCTINLTCRDFYNTPVAQGSASDIGAAEFSAGALFTVTITTPTSSPTLTVTSSPLQLGGTSGQSGGTVSWSCDRCGSGTASGTASWLTGTIALKEGVNVITVNGTDGTGNTGNPDIITVTFAPSPPSTVLIMAYGFESGTTAVDSSGNKNTGTLINGAAFTSATGGRYGRGIALNGVNQYIDVANSTSLALTQAFTISAWVKIATTHSNNLAIVHKNALPLNSPYELYGSTTGYCGGGAIGGFANVNGATGPYYNACDPGLLSPGIWTHLAVTYDSAAGQLKLYKNGALLQTTGASGYLETSSLALYVGGSEFGEYFDGALDEIRIYNYAIPLTGGANTVYGAPCNYTASISTPSIVGDANCPVVAVAPPLKFEVGAGSSFAIGAGSTFAIGAQ